MRRLLPLLVGCGFIFLLNAPVIAQKEKNQFAPPGNLTPSDGVLKQIEAKTAQLAAKIAELRKDKKRHEFLPDVEIFLRAAENIVRYKEFYHKDSGKWTLDTLDRGMDRAKQLASGTTPWTTPEKSNVLRAYRSQIDGTAQPYGVTYPLAYGKDTDRKWRVDIVLHGRNSTLTEVSFLNTHNGKKQPPAEQDWVQIDIFGRGNNAYRWAGETDVFEAMEAFFANEATAGRVDLPDRRRVVLRGFSMGGAGAWHLGLHHPDKWCVMGPGAGFTTTHDYAWKGKKELPDYQEKCLRIYDAIDYVENARMIPIVAYSGSEDAQKLAADNIENRLKELKIDTMTHLVAPGLGHTFPAEWFKKANAHWSKHAGKVRTEIPKKFSLVTYTSKFSQSGYIMIDGLQRHYDKASVEVELTKAGCNISAQNVRRIWLVLPMRESGFMEGDRTADININGMKIKAPALVVGKLATVILEQHEGKWKGVPNAEFASRPAEKLEKLFSLQGPIDDAFASGFVCVIGSGETFHPSTQKFVDAKLTAFKYDWGKHWRGELPTTGDYAVTPNDIMDKHLILFGDPQSNLTLAQMMPKLPLKWTKDEIEFAGRKFKTSEHVPVLIFPNPLNPHKYVVLNTGHTFPSADYTKTNALLYPRLGDYAILRMTPDGHEVALAGLFDEFWRVEKK